MGDYDDALGACYVTMAWLGRDKVGERRVRHDPAIRAERKRQRLARRRQRKKGG